MSSLLHAFSGHIGIFPTWLFLLQAVSALAIIYANDWYRDTREERRQSSIRALEALFTLPDPRDVESHRLWRRD